MMTVLSLDIIRDKKEWQKTLSWMEAWQAKMYKIYQARTGKSRKEIRQIFQEEEALSAEKSKRLGLIDEIIDKLTIEIKPLTETEIVL
jgi:ATP-dependent protease ClpP protease subunit